MSILKSRKIEETYFPENRPNILPKDPRRAPKRSPSPSQIFIFFDFFSYFFPIFFVFYIKKKAIEKKRTSERISYLRSAIESVQGSYKAPLQRNCLRGIGKSSKRKLPYKAPYKDPGIKYFILGKMSSG